MHNKFKKISTALFILTLFLTIAGCGGSKSGEGVSGSERSGYIALSWYAPTTNDDGTSLNDLAGYKVYYGTASNNYTESIDIGNSTSFEISNLSSGTWCFAVTAYDILGNESGYSGEVCTDLS